MSLFKKAAKKTGMAAAWTLAAVAVYYSSCFALPQAISFRISEKIETQSEMERLVEEEKKKLNCDKIIHSKILEENEGHAFKLKDKEEYLVVVGGFASNVSELKHEVYHICDGHLEDKINPVVDFVKYWLWHEPKATLYQVFDLDL